MRPGEKDIANMNNIKMTSGRGQYHTNEPDPAKPDKLLTPYRTIDIEGIRALVDNPQQVEKAQPQWLIPSTLPSRNFKEQEEEGRFLMLWADLDKKPPCLFELANIVTEIIGDCDFELYNSKSATADNQKARLLIPLQHSINGECWLLAQEILNDKLDALSIVPDRKNQGAAQLCYLPNAGRFYGSVSKRNGKIL